MPAPVSFGQALPVLGLNNGFPGTFSRLHPTIASRQVLSTTPNNLLFGAPCVIIADSQGGTVQSVADFIAAAAGNSGSVYGQFGGIAVREVKTVLTYQNGLTPGTQQTGFFAPGEMADILEAGSVCVPIVEGTPVSQAPVYVRVFANTSTGTFTANTAVGSNVLLSVSSFTGVQLGQGLSGTGIPSGTIVGAVNTTASTITMVFPGGLPALATAAGTGTTVTFSNTVTAVGDLEAEDDVAATTTMTAVAASANITVASATGINVGQIAVGGSIPPGTGVTVVSGTTITLSVAVPTVAAPGTAVTFHNTLALPLTVFRTGNLDANFVAEITLKARVAA